MLLLLVIVSLLERVGYTGHRTRTRAGLVGREDGEDGSRVFEGLGFGGEVRDLIDQGTRGGGR